MCLCLIPEQDRVALETLFDFWKKRPDERTDYISTCFTCTVDVPPSVVKGKLLFLVSQEFGRKWLLGFIFSLRATGALKLMCFTLLRSTSAISCRAALNTIGKKGAFLHLSRKSLLFFSITKEIQKEQIFHKDKQNTRSGVFLKHARILTNTVR